MKMVIAVVGAGGKTTRIHKLAEQYRKLDKKVLVTTTTHMYREEGVGHDDPVCILVGSTGQSIGPGAVLTPLAREILEGKQ